MPGVNPKPDSGVEEKIAIANEPTDVPPAHVLRSENNTHEFNVSKSSETVSDDGGIAKVQAHDVTGLAVVEQGHTIPMTGERKITTKWEYWAYCLYGTSYDDR